MCGGRGGGADAAALAAAAGVFTRGTRDKAGKQLTGGGLATGWEGVLEKFTADEVLPRMANKTAIGVFLGCARCNTCSVTQVLHSSSILESPATDRVSIDHTGRDEICCHNSSCWHGQLYPLSAKLRALLGPDAILCGHSALPLPLARTHKHTRSHQNNRHYHHHHTPHATNSKQT